jgi:[ribosomal protein S5]-alanine N-acetyltransferase
LQKNILDIPTYLETERLYLRCYQPEDGGWFYAMSQRNLAHLARYETDNPIRSIKTASEAEALVNFFIMDWIARSNFFLGVFLKGGQEFVGQIYIGLPNASLPEFELGYFADVAHEGRGFITEAARGSLELIFHTLHAHRVRLECDDTNQRSSRVAERCGLLREGHLRENKRGPDGTLSGTFLYGMLRAEFESMYPR